MEKQDQTKQKSKEQKGSKTGTTARNAKFAK